MYDFYFWQNGPVKDKKDKPLNLSILQCTYHVFISKRKIKLWTKKSLQNHAILFIYYEKRDELYTRSRGAPTYFYLKLFDDKYFIINYYPKP